MLPPQISQFKGKINGNYQIDCKKKHDTNEEVGLQPLFASESGPFAQNETIRRAFFHHNYYKKGEKQNSNYKTGGTETW